MIFCVYLPIIYNFDSGTAGRDDDRPQEYGSVVYIYNENSVRLYAPNARNNYDTGYVIYTGESHKHAHVHAYTHVYFILFYVLLSVK